MHKILLYQLVQLDACTNKLVTLMPMWGV